MRHSPPTLLRHTTCRDEYCTESETRDGHEVIDCMEAFLLSEIDALDGPQVREIRKHLFGRSGESWDEQQKRYGPYLDLLRHLYAAFTEWTDKRLERKAS